MIVSGGINLNMKNFLRKIVLWILGKLAIHRLKKFGGKIVGVTGSIGKTTTKEAIFCVLNSKFKVKRSEKSMNTDFGLLLTILDIDSGYASATKWAWLLLKALFHSFYKETADILLLEMGVDKPGDMDYLMKIAKPDVAVLTNVAPVHMEEGQFKTLENIFDEKCKMIDALKEGGVAILNIDNSFIDGLPKKCKKKKVITYGRKSEAEFKPEAVSYDLSGLKFHLKHDHHIYEFLIPVLGEYQVYAFLPAIVCGLLWDMKMEEIIVALERFSLPPGRMSILPAKNDATILDSSYNSSPEALRAALEVLKHVAGDRRKVAVIGNMNELGSDAKMFHEKVGEVVPRFADLLLTVGANAAALGQKAVESGMNEKNVFSFKNVSEAIDFFKKHIKKNDVILVKGSQNNVRLEKFVREFIANPEDAEKLLVRQEKFWLNK
jgi:UDP-N-acetylmuramoyl-tripeptide--D-alanyl-D-alanine ligase